MLPTGAEELGRLNALLDEWVALTRSALTLDPEDQAGVTAVLDRREQLMPLIARLAAAADAGGESGDEPDAALQRERQRCLELCGQAAEMDRRWAEKMAERLEDVTQQLGRVRAARRLGRSCGGREEAADARFLDRST